jgi:hypothetical protein
VLHLFLGALLVARPPAHPEPRHPPVGVEAPFRRGSVTVADPVLASLIQDLSLRSPSFARALETLAEGETPLVVGSPAQLHGQLPRAMRRHAPIAYTVAVHDQARDPEGPRVRRVLVVVDLAAYQRLYATDAQRSALALDLEVILAHEIAGHAVGWALTGRLREGCLDPDPLTVATQPGVTGCAVEKENAIRRELGVAERPTYGHLIYPSGRSHDAVQEAYARGEI